MVTTLGLTECLGLPILDADGVRVGRLSDLAAHLDDDVPVVSRLRFRTRRLGGQHDIPFSAVAGMDASGIRLGVPADELVEGPLREDELLLRRHVLDAQIVDVVGRRLTRVEDVLLERDGPSLRVVAVEVGTGAALRRLGLARLAARLTTHIVPWDALHITSGRGHALQVEATASALHGLGPEEVADLAGRLPAHHAEQLLARLPSGTAAAARALGRRSRRFRLARARRHART
jgi:sporulation protein YlmC with PRC-barrel domain